MWKQPQAPTKVISLGRSPQPGSLWPCLWWHPSAPKVISKTVLMLRPLVPRSIVSSFKGHLGKRTANLSILAGAGGVQTRVLGHAPEGKANAACAPGTADVHRVVVFDAHDQARRRMCQRRIGRRAWDLQESDLDQITLTQVLFPVSTHHDPGPQRTKNRSLPYVNTFSKQRFIRSTLKHLICQVNNTVIRIMPWRRVSRGR